jgi:hypothetical protein
MRLVRTEEGPYVNGRHLTEIWEIARESGVREVSVDGSWDPQYASADAFCPNSDVRPLRPVPKNALFLVVRSTGCATVAQIG